MEICNGEVNFLTEEVMGRVAMITELQHEFDFICFCQALMNPYGIQARELLDKFIALSLRKLLVDKDSLLIKVCPDFKMPPLTGDTFDCPGENQDMKLKAIWTETHVKKQNEWIPVYEWLDQIIAKIEKTADDIPELVSDRFFQMILRATGQKTDIQRYYQPEEIEDNEKNETVWRLRAPEENRIKVFMILKEYGYYDLSIHRMIKHIADKQAAHVDSGKSMWINMENTSKDMRQSALSVFATQMIYAATRQIRELKDYWNVKPLLETLE